MAVHVEKKETWMTNKQDSTLLLIRGIQIKLMLIPCPLLNGINVYKSDDPKVEEDMQKDKNVMSYLTEHFGSVLKLMICIL